MRACQAEVDATTCFAIELGRIVTPIPAAMTAVSVLADFDFGDDARNETYTRIGGVDDLANDIVRPRQEKIHLSN